MKGLFLYVIRNTIWWLYYLFCILPATYYFWIRSVLRLAKEKEYKGDCDFGNKICVFASYPLTGKIPPSLRNYLLNIKNLGYSTIFIANTEILTEEVEALKSLCVRILIRENFGRDFGAYKRGLLKYRDQITDAAELLIANDSVILIRDLSDMFNHMESCNADLWGATEAYGDGMYNKHHIGSYFLVLSNKILKSAVFWTFWENYQNSNSRRLIIDRGELDFNTSMRNAGFRTATYINSTKLYKFFGEHTKKIRNYLNEYIILKAKDAASAQDMDLDLVSRLLYKVNHNVYFLKALIELDLPFIKKDTFSRGGYPVVHISELLQQKGIIQHESILDELMASVKPKKVLKDFILEFIGEK